MEIVRLKQQLFLQKEEIAMLKSQQKTRMKPKTINTRMKPKSSKSYRNGYNGYNVSQTPTNNKSKKSLLKKSKTTTNWRSSSNTFDSGTHKNNPKNKFNKFSRNKSDADSLPKTSPKLGTALSAPVYTETEKKKKRNKGKKKNDKNLNNKIKGLSALDLFVKEYEDKKKKVITDDDFAEEWIDDVMD